MCGISHDCLSSGIDVQNMCDMLPIALEGYWEIFTPNHTLIGSGISRPYWSVLHVSRGGVYQVPIPTFIVVRLLDVSDWSSEHFTWHIL